MVFDGINDHVDLPIGTLISTLTSATFASWVNVDSLMVAAWPRIFDFGTGNTNYIMLTPHQGTDGPLTCDIRVNHHRSRRDSRPRGYCRPVGITWPSWSMGRP